MPASSQISGVGGCGAWGEGAPFSTLAASACEASTYLPHHQPCLKEAVLIPARADCTDESDFALYTSAGPVRSHRSPKTGRPMPPGC